MKLWLGVSLLLSASVALAYTSAIQTSQRLVGTASVGEAVDIYNKDSRENAAFRLLEVDSGHGEEGALPLKFKIKETLCLKTEKQNLQKCDFKDNGLVKACSASLLEEPDRPALVVNCDSVTIPSFRSKRSRGSSSSRSSSRRSSIRSSRRSSSTSNGNRRNSERKPERSTKSENPVHPGMFAAFGPPILQTKEVQNKKKGSNENKRQPRAKNCTGGINCKKGPLSLSPSAFSTIERHEPAAADTKPLHPKRSPNTNGNSNGNRRRHGRPKSGFEFVKRRYFAIGKLPTDSVFAGTAAHATSPKIFESHPPSAQSVFNTLAPITSRVAFRPKRSPNTNGSSNGNRKKPTKPKCRAGNKCEKEPIGVNTGRWSAIAQVPVDSVLARPAVHANSP